ncbi:MAG: MBL fold metallo-hydrolase [Erysipelotrichales bacterium]|nr:MBL fold metallo-hydrolase [Erysipelotrichales bacterium]
MDKIKKLRYAVKIFAVILVMSSMFILASCDLLDNSQNTNDNTTTNNTTNNNTTNNNTTNNTTNNNTDDDDDNGDDDSRNNEMRVYFLDVGQGDAVFIRFPGGETMLIDAGRWNLTHNAFRRRIREFFPDQERMQFDWFITTHSHADHIGSADFIVNNSYIRNIVRPITFTQAEVSSGAYRDFGISPGSARMQQTATFQRFVTAMETSRWIDGSDTNIYIPMAGKYFYVGSLGSRARVTFYSPTTYNYNPNTNTFNVNHYSTIFCIYFAGQRIMFTGDAYYINEQNVLDSLPRNVNVLDVGHHGSSTSSGQTFLDHIRPTYAIIQVGTTSTGNGYGHPHQVVLNRFLAMDTIIKRTDQLGDILIQICLETSRKRVGALVPAY